MTAVEGTRCTLVVVVFVVQSVREVFECLPRYRVRARHATRVLQENDPVPIYIQ